MSNVSRRMACMGAAFALTLATGMSVADESNARRSTDLGRDQDLGGAIQNILITAALRAEVKNIVVIYAENRAFDNLYGHFPGANGLDAVVDRHGNPTKAYHPQLDRDGSVLATLPQTWGGVTAAGVTPAVTQAQSAGLPNAPFSIESAFTPSSGVTLSTFTVTRDLYHRFYENQMEIDGGKNDKFAAWADAGGLTMGHYDNSQSALYKLASQYTLADDFFAGVYGGSFLNHQYLICACAPVYPNADAPPSGAHPTIAVLDKDAQGNYLPQLTTSATSPASAIDGPPSYMLSGNITPANYFGDGQFYAVNTMQAPYQPSGNQPVDANGNDLLYANPAANTTLPPQTQTNIGDELTAANVSWKWYAGSWNAAIADGTQAPGAARTVIYTPSSARGAPDYQAHHAPFNYYSEFDPVAHAADRAAHLQDYTRSRGRRGRRETAGRGVLQATGKPEPARGLRQPRRRRRPHRGSRRQIAGQPAMGAYGDRDHLRRVRRCLGSRRAAPWGPAGSGHPDSGDRHFAFLTPALRRSHAI